MICQDKKILDKKAAKKNLERSLRYNYYYSGGFEWPYKNVKPRIIAEEYLEDLATKELRDYKFFTFGGKVKAMFVASDRMNDDVETKFDFFDSDFKHLPVVSGHPNAERTPDKPKSFYEMKILAEKLSDGIPEVRVDFYEMNGKIYFGEMTFFHWGGFIPFEPMSFDVKLGGWIKLPLK